MNELDGPTVPTVVAAVVGATVVSTSTSVPAVSSRFVETSVIATVTFLHSTVVEEPAVA